MYNSHMPTTPNPAQIVGWRQKRLRDKRRHPGGLLPSLGSGVAALFSVMLMVGISWGASAYASLTTDLPSIESLPIWLGPDGLLQQPTRIYDQSGEFLLVTLENPSAAEAEYLYLELIPQNVVNAVLAIRDPGFWEHSGYTAQADKPSMAEQLISDLLLWGEPEGWQRQWRTRLLATQITRTYGRETILEWYLNHANFGQLAYGVDEAAWVYFGKPVAEVTLAEAALLAAAVDAPGLNPIDAPQIATDRQRQVLSAMLAFGHISEQQALTANEQAILLQTSALPLDMQAPDFTILVLDTLNDSLGIEQVQRGGLEVFTTLDIELQQEVACALEIQLARLNGMLPVDTLGDTRCPSATLLPTMNKKDIQPGSNPQGGAVVIDPQNGQVLALVGNAAQPHLAGTSLSPFVYLTAFTRGMSPASLVWDIPASIPPTLEGYGNLDGTYLGPVRIRTAVAFDHVVPILAVLRQIGPANAWRTAQQSGVLSLQIPESEDSYSPLLDQGQVSLLEITHAYSMFANQGNLAGNADNASGLVTAAIIRLVRDNGGGIWIDNQTQIRAITTPQLAYLVTDMLSDELARRESLGHPNLLEIGRPAAAKLGQALTFPDTWAIGYTPDRVVGVWVGYETGGSVTEASLSPLPAAGIWHALMKLTHQDIAIHDWNEPLGITRLVVCNPSGLLPTKECPQTVPEVFITGNEPLHSDNLYRTFLINSQTKRLATIYTPAEFLEEKVYLVVPPVAQEWAIQQSYELPPDTYDVIFNPTTASQSANIQSPAGFSYISGEIQIRGSAGGENFDYYRVQVGAGLNPRQWLQLGEETNRTVTEGLLATWDTSGLDGLYAIRLQVVRTDQSIETAVIQVTIDNQPPVAQVLQPAEGQVFSYPENKNITFQVQALDNLGLQKIEFWVDRRLITAMSDPPYTALWPGTPGEHTLEVRVTDLAGNQTSTTVQFTLEE